MPKPQLAMYWAASCGGCEISLLEIGEHLLELVAAVDLMFCPCLLDTKYADVEALPDGAIDVCLFNGAIRTAENAEFARLLRRKSKVLVAYGACAHLGGIPGLANLKGNAALLERAFLTAETVVNPAGVIPGPESRLPNGEPARLTPLQPTVQTLAQVVAVDYAIPGCPPEGPQVWAVCQALLAGELPAPGALLGAGEGSVCEECPLEKGERPLPRVQRPYAFIPDGKTCLLEQGLICSGIGTRSGCQARCPSVLMPCRGCYGPTGRSTDHGASLVGGLGALVGEGSADAIRETLAGFADPAGTLYRFSLPASPLGAGPPRLVADGTPRSGTPSDGGAP